MSRRVTAFHLFTAIVALGLTAGAAHAASPRGGTPAGELYGYSYRVDTRDVYTDGARSGQFDPYSEGARNVAPVTRERDDDRSLSGMDRRGVSAEPARTVDVYTDGAAA
ncbi:hypothetical protein [Cupriavidus pauculus]|uniref:Copper resistance protein CopQ n=1 Tax=Cupriavidus pauculus TaxID=82633 RepID=A0A3G8H6W8_9BURK|nr:hypothetical protein [Cupriavidus pauculus]AZG15979.1 hypothetical protein EHF44_21360 [Cupriavidus pauculus]